MLTIFGKKKKDEPGGDKPLQGLPGQVAPAGPSHGESQFNPQIQVSPSSPTVTQPSAKDQPLPPPPSRTISSQPMLRPVPPGTPLPEEETSLTRILRSLVQDIPMPAEIGMNSFVGSTPDYVPLRQTPPSRPMIIGSGKDDGGEWEEKDESSTGKQSPSVPVRPGLKPADSPPQPTKPPSKSAEKLSEKPTRIEKQAEKPSAPKRETRTPQGFDHIFQLTQGNLENTGFVVINGAQGSGRTTLCSGLTVSYLKMGNPCLYLTYDQTPSSLRDLLKKLGADAAQYESQFRFIMIDGYASQSDAFSMEPYYLDQPFSLDNIQDALVRNSGIFAGERIRVFFDSLDKLVPKIPQKDFAKNFGDLVNKLKESGATFIVTVNMAEVPKDVVGSLVDMADCIVDLSKDNSDPNGRQLKVQRLNQKSSKIDPETFEIDSTKGLVFV